MKNNIIRILKNVLLASTTTSIPTCLQLTGCKALSTDVSFPSVHPIAKLKAAVLLAEQHYHRNLKQSCVKNQACCTMAEGNLCRTLTFLEHSLTPTRELQQVGTRKHIKKLSPCSTICHVLLDTQGSVWLAWMKILGAPCT